MKKFLVPLATLLLPVAAFAQSFTHVNSLIGEVMAIASQAVNFLMILATLFFILIVVQLIMEKDGKARDEKKQQLKWAIIGLAAMVCVWGLIRFAASTLGIDTSNNLGGGAVPCPPGMVYDSSIGCH